MASYIGVNGKARKIKAIYVGVNGKARKVKNVFTGVSGKAKLAFKSFRLEDIDHIVIRPNKRVVNQGTSSTTYIGNDDAAVAKAGSMTFVAVESTSYNQMTVFTNYGYQIYYIMDVLVVTKDGSEFPIEEAVKAGATVKANVYRNLIGNGIYNGIVLGQSTIESTYFNGEITMTGDPPGYMNLTASQIYHSTWGKNDTMRHWLRVNWIKINGTSYPITWETKWPT